MFIIEERSRGHVSFQGGGGRVRPDTAYMHTEGKYTSSLTVKQSIFVNSGEIRDLIYPNTLHTCKSMRILCILVL